MSDSSNSTVAVENQMENQTVENQTVRNRVSFDYMTARVRDLIPHTAKRGEKIVVDQMVIDGRTVAPTERFWTSFFAKFGFGNSTFKWFDHTEVFDRISDRAPSDELRLCIEKMPGKPERLLAISSPSSVLVKHDDLIQLLGDNGIDINNADYGQRSNSFQPFQSSGGSIDPQGIRIGRIGGDQHDRDGNLIAPPAVPQLSYDTGVVRSIHTPRNASAFQVAGDEFSNRFAMDTPVDGYGKPSIYLMLLRQICANGSIGYSRVFRSDISLGKGEDSFEYALTRAFEGYNNEEGFDALRQRYESAAHSWASINEINKTYKAIVRAHYRGEMRVAGKYLSAETSGADGTALMEGSPIIQSFHQMVGNLTQAYGLANLDALSVKRQRTLPAGCSIYELLNFVTEVATHHSTPAGARAMQAITGDFLAAEYDLEGTKDKFGDWTDFLVMDKNAIESMTIAQNK